MSISHLICNIWGDFSMTDTGLNKIIKNCGNHSRRTTDEICCRFKIVFLNSDNPAYCAKKVFQDVFFYHLKTSKASLNMENRTGTRKVKSALSSPLKETTMSLLNFSKIALKCVIAENMSGEPCSKMSCRNYRFHLIFIRSMPRPMT